MASGSGTPSYFVRKSDWHFADAAQRCQHRSESTEQEVSIAPHSNARCILMESSSVETFQRALGNKSNAGRACTDNVRHTQTINIQRCSNCSCCNLYIYASMLHFVICKLLICYKKCIPSFRRSSLMTYVIILFETD